MKLGNTVTILLVVISSCTSKQQDRMTPSRTAIFFHYVDKTIGTDMLPFDATDEYNVILYSGNGCSYCNQSSLNYISRSNLSNLVVFTSDKPTQLKNLEKVKVYYDTITNNLAHVNLRADEGPVYLKIRENKVIAYVFITSLNVDSLFTTIEQKVAID